MNPPQQPHFSNWISRFPPLVCVLLGLASLFVGVHLRTEDLGKRPMHTDEAVHGVKLVHMMQEGKFTYDPSDYHGPTLHYTTAIMTRLLGWDLNTLNDEQLRISIALWGIALLLLVPFFWPLWKLRDARDVPPSLPWIITTFLIVFVSHSPSMVYFSRYYIMEMILIVLLMFALFVGIRWRLGHQNGWRWALLFGIAMAGMHATKETFLISMGGVGVGYFAARIWPGVGWQQDWEFFKKRKWEFLLCFLSFLFTSAALFSSCFQDCQAIVDSYRTYLLYFQRAGGAGGHEKPWDYYLQVLFYWKSRPLSFGEPLTGIMALVSLAWLRQKSPLKIWTLGLWGYALSTLAVYSIIPYKTPWSILPVQLAFLILASIGCGFAWSFAKSRWATLLSRAALMVVMSLGLHSFWKQNMIANFRLASDPRNPFVYNHTVPDSFRLVETILQLSELDGRKHELPIQVFERARSAWPLPWYLRNFTHIGYWDHLQENQALHAPVIVMELEMISELPESFKEQYTPSDFGLMPNRMLILWVQKDLRKKWLEERIKSNS